MVEHGGAMGAVLGSLGDLGYGFAYRVLDAQFFGVPQRRRRVVIVGCLGDDRRPVEVLLEPEGSGGDYPAGESSRPRVAPTADAGSDLPSVVSTLQGGGQRGHRVDAESAAGGHLVPVTFQKVVRSGERDADGNLPAEVWAEREVAATLNCGDNASESRAVELIVHPLALRGRDEGAQLEVGPAGGPYNALRAGDGGSSRQSLVAISIDTRNAARSSGTGVGTQGTGIGSPGDPSYTVTAAERAIPAVAFHLTQDPISGDVVPAMGGKSGGNGVMTETTVRRLTPRECERLQGFPDGWTATSWGKPQADSARYRQMGNAVAVPVFEWVAQRIVQSEAAA
jgi:DNA (cytosine-5)-methyltransferase 1